MTDLTVQIGSTAALFGAGALSVCAYSVFAPTSQFCFPIISRGDASGPPRVTLTFDDGPGTRGTPLILDALAKLRVQATFFVIGANAERYPDLIRRMDAEGHIVANHSYDHRHFGAARRPRYWRDQLRRTDAVIVNILGKRPAFFRPPLGIKSWWMGAPLRDSGHTAVCWSKRGLDGIATTPQRILRRLATTAKAGDIILLHDGCEPWSSRDPAPTVAAIEPLVRAIRAHGIEFARLDQLINLEPYFPARNDLARAPLASPELVPI